MNEDLRKLLDSWEVEREYIDNIEKAKIFKISTLKLLPDQIVDKLIPDIGPQIEFKEKLKELRTEHYECVLSSDVQDENGNAVSVLVPTNRTKTWVPPGDALPDIFMEDDEPVAGQQRETSETTKKATEKLEKSRLLGGKDPAAPDSLSLCPMDASFDLKKLLLSCIKGRVLLSVYETKKDLNDKDRNSLGDLLISDFLKTDLNRRLSYDAEKAMTAHIVKLFPTEREGLWKSCSANNRQRAEGRGKLVVRYYHLRRIMLAASLIQRKPSDAGLSDNEGEVSDGDGATEDQRLLYEESDLFLKNDKTPWSKVHTLWQETLKWRVSKLLNSTVTIADYMKRYPALQEPTGYLLLETDFEKLYPSSNMKLYIEWPLLSAFIKNKITATSKKQAEEMESSLTEDGKKLRILRSLPFLFSPVTAVKKKKKQWRPSRAEVADGLILHVKVSLNPKDIQLDIETRRKKYAEFDLPMGPLAVVVGQDEDNISASYLVINRITYEVDSPLKALDLAFKATHALDAEYNKDVIRECLFLHHAINDITLKRGTKQKKTLKDQKDIDVIEEYKRSKGNGQQS